MIGTRRNRPLLHPRPPLAVARGQTLQGLSLDPGEISLGFIQRGGAEILTNICGEEHLEERGDKVIDTLDVSAGWMSNSPHVKYSF